MKIAFLSATLISIFLFLFTAIIKPFGRLPHSSVPNLSPSSLPILPHSRPMGTLQDQQPQILSNLRSLAPKEIPNTKFSPYRFPLGGDSQQLLNPSHSTHRSNFTCSPAIESLPTVSRTEITLRTISYRVTTYLLHCVVKGPLMISFLFQTPSKLFMALFLDQNTLTSSKSSLTSSSVSIFEEYRTLPKCFRESFAGVLLRWCDVSIGFYILISYLSHLRAFCRSLYSRNAAWKSILYIFDGRQKAYLAKLLNYSDKYHQRGGIESQLSHFLVLLYFVTCSFWLYHWPDATESWASAYVFIAELGLYGVFFYEFFMSYFLTLIYFWWLYYRNSRVRIITLKETLLNWTLRITYDLLCDGMSLVLGTMFYRSGNTSKERFLKIRRILTLEEIETFKKDAAKRRTMNYRRKVLSMENSIDSLFSGPSSPQIPETSNESLTESPTKSSTSSPTISPISSSTGSPVSSPSQSSFCSPSGSPLSTSTGSFTAARLITQTIDSVSSDGNFTNSSSSSASDYSDSPRSLHSSTTLETDKLISEVVRGIEESIESARIDEATETALQDEEIFWSQFVSKPYSFCIQNPFYERFLGEVF